MELFRRRDKDAQCKQQGAQDDNENTKGNKMRKEIGVIKINTNKFKHKQKKLLRHGNNIIQRYSTRHLGREP